MVIIYPHLWVLCSWGGVGLPFYASCYTYVFEWGVYERGLYLCEWGLYERVCMNGVCINATFVNKTYISGFFGVAPTAHIKSRLSLLSFDI